MKKKIMITVASLAALGAAVAGYLHFSGRTPGFVKIKMQKKGSKKCIAQPAP